MKMGKSLKLFISLSHTTHMFRFKTNPNRERKGKKAKGRKREMRPWRGTAHAACWSRLSVDRASCAARTVEDVQWGSSGRRMAGRAQWWCSECWLRTEKRNGRVSQPDCAHTVVRDIAQAAAQWRTRAAVARWGTRAQPRRGCLKGNSAVGRNGGIAGVSLFCFLWSPCFVFGSWSFFEFTVVSGFYWFRIGGNGGGRAINRQDMFVSVQRRWLL